MLDVSEHNACSFEALEDSNTRKLKQRTKCGVENAVLFCLVTFSATGHCGRFISFRPAGSGSGPACRRVIGLGKVGCIGRESKNPSISVCHVRVWTPVLNADKQNFCC